MTQTVDIKRRPLFELGSLSSVASLAAIIVAMVTGISKLDTISNKSATNCQLLAGGIVLTLEASRARAVNNRVEQAFLNEQQRRFERIAREC